VPLSRVRRQSKVEPAPTPARLDAGVEDAVLVAAARRPDAPLVGCPLRWRTFHRGRPHVLPWSRPPGWATRSLTPEPPHPQPPFTRKG